MNRADEVFDGYEGAGGRRRSRGGAAYADRVWVAPISYQPLGFADRWRLGFFFPNILLLKKKIN